MSKKEKEIEELRKANEIYKKLIETPCTYEEFMEKHIGDMVKARLMYDFLLLLHLHKKEVHRLTEEIHLKVG